MQAGLSISLLPPHPLIHHQPQPTLEPHSGPGRDWGDIGDIQVEAVMQREHLALHARFDNRRLAFGLDGFIAPNYPITDFETEGLFSPAVNA